MIEQKDTESNSISLKKSWIDKIMQEARKANKSGAMVITLGKGSPDEVTVFVISKPDFLNYRTMLGEQDGSV